MVDKMISREDELTKALRAMVAAVRMVRDGDIDAGDAMDAALQKAQAVLVPREVVAPALRLAFEVLKTGDEKDVQAALTIAQILSQVGCEHFDASCVDGRLTTLMDIIIYG